MGIRQLLSGVGVGQRVTQGSKLLVRGVAFALNLFKALLQFGTQLIIPATDAFELILQTAYLSNQCLFFQPGG
jgi:hypothetical protein